MSLDREAKVRELESLRERVRQLEQELEAEEPRQWPPRHYYAAYHALAGFVLGMFGATTSLLFNIAGSLLVAPAPGVPETPLRLINVYLTFPMGERALGIESGLALVIGICLYLATGMLLGIPFHLILSRWFDEAPLGKRLVVASILSLAIWVINFYVLLSWLQPLLFGGNWIVRLTPWWVAALTHLVFGWTMALVQPLGTFDPGHRGTRPETV